MIRLVRRGTGTLVDDHGARSGAVQPSEVAEVVVFPCPCDYQPTG